VPKRQSYGLLHASSVLDQLPDGVLLLDTEGRIQFSNAEITRLFGWLPEELAGQPVEILVPDDQRRSHVGQRKRYMAAPEGRPMASRTTLRGQHKSGRTFPIGVNLGNRISGGLFVTVVRDLQPLHDLDRERRRVLEDLIGRSEHLERLSRSAAGITHDLRNVLTVIAGTGEELALQGVSTEQCVNPIVEAAAQATSLVARLDDLAGTKRVTARPLEINATLLELEPLLRSLAGSQVDLRLRLASKPLIVRSNSQDIARILVNLVVNARESMPQGGLMHIETRSEPWESGSSNAGAFLSVRDNGHGMDTETQERIFLPHFTTKPEGTGIGLATVAEIVDRNEGRIQVESQPYGGTCFTICLPQIVKPLPEAVEVRAQVAGRRASW